MIQQTKKENQQPRFFQDPPLVLGDAHPQWVMVWLHGLGADGHNFAPAVDRLSLPRTRWVLPHAPYRAVTYQGGNTLRAWYDIHGLQAGHLEDKQGIMEAESALVAILAEQARQVGWSRVWLGGFSQGGALALHTALRLQDPIAGCVGLSTYLPLSREPASRAGLPNVQVFLAHGLLDPVIPLPLALWSLEQLRARGVDPAWHTDNVWHEVSPGTWDALHRWLLDRMAY